jgi:hypothetical protein
MVPEYSNLLSIDMADLNENTSVPLTYCESLKSYVLAVSTKKIIELQIR